jgi:hypothetical protein
LMVRAGRVDRRPRRVWPVFCGSIGKSRLRLFFDCQKPPAALLARLQKA